MLATEKETIDLLFCTNHSKQSSEVQIHVRSTQPAFTCSNLTIKTLEQGVKYVQS